MNSVKENIKYPHSYPHSLFLYNSISSTNIILFNAEKSLINVHIF